MMLCIEILLTRRRPLSEIVSRRNLSASGRSISQGKGLVYVKITLPLLETTFPSTETVVIVNHLRSGQNDLVVNRVPSFSYITIEPDADGFTIEPVIDSVTG